MRILIHNPKLPNNNFHLILSIWRACLESLQLEAEIANAQSFHLAIRNFRPDIVLTIGGEQIPDYTFKTLREQKQFQWVLWTTEDPFEIAYHQTIAKYFDYVFTSDQMSQSLYDHPHCYYLPLAADSELFFHPVIEHLEDLFYDLTFIGTAWPNRVQFLKNLVTQAKVYDLKIRFILPTNPYIPLDVTQEIGLHKFEHNFRVSPSDLATLQNYSLFTLTILRDFSADGKSRPQTSPTNRFFETALAGTGQIFVSKETTITHFFPELANSIYQCQEVHEIIETILAAKKTPVSRNLAAQKVQKFVLDHHSYAHRLQEILAKVSGKPI
ncbi:MAG: glycosyltransferase [Scytolyngbya sp. HA4215-MV1]|nr:glycosyltransferase [Scytolyngbya sp. HA4215-MV1]